MDAGSRKTSRIPDKQQKLHLMVKQPLNHPSIAWPEELIVDSKTKQAIGYTMKMVSGKPLQHVTFGKPQLQKSFPNWNRMDLVKLTRNILELIELLHAHGVIIGDLNPLNIMLENAEQVAIVDTDSFQIMQYPCPVGTINFTAPEIQGKDFKSFLRTHQHDLFAIATLIFMILMPGKPPYSHQGGGDPRENIKIQKFSYTIDQSPKDAPRGPWRFIWSHFPRYIKEIFVQTFARNNRPSIQEWQGNLKRYQWDLSKKYVSSEIFPTSYKKVSTEQKARFKNN